LTAPPVERVAGPLSGTFDFASWRLERARLVAACGMLAFAAATWLAGGVWRLLAVLLVLDVAVQALPWRLPRGERSALSICAEEALYVVVPTLFLAVAAARGEDWIAATPAVWWWAVAVAAGVGLVWLGGMQIRALVSGALAFVAPPLRRPHKWARAASMVVAPPGEEAVFRGAALAASSAAALPLGLLGAVAFVSRHHLPPGVSARTPARAVVTQIVSAAALLGLTLAAGSIYPALLAHYVNNAPSVLLEVQRRTREG
jgi:hypothetical protein